METLEQIQTMTLPEPISAERISYLINEKGIDPSVATIDLSMVKMKLQNQDEGLDWTYEQCESAEIEYKRYLHLCKVYGKGIVPSKMQDEMWHYHILDTRAYHKDCEEVFGYYMHHFPYFGMRGEDDAKNLENAFYKTKDLYEKEFGEPMSRSEHMKCWNDCKNRCWHACSNK